MLTCPRTMMKHDDMMTDETWQLHLELQFIVNK
jgi:hypothetical protein